jgi:hypothetical protein
MEARGAETKRPGSQVLLIGIGVAVVLLIGVALVLALQPTPQLDPATPEGAVQGYLEAVLDDDFELARSYLTDPLADRCAPSEFDYRSERSASVVIVDVETRGDRVRVDVEITETSGTDLFVNDLHRFDEAFVLEQQGGRWLIAEPPWPIYYCPEASP